MIFGSSLDTNFLLTSHRCLSECLNMFCFSFKTLRLIKRRFSTWQQYRQESICVESDNSHGSLLCTLPFPASQLDLRYSSFAVVENPHLIESCGRQIKSLCLRDIPSLIAASFIILGKCRRIKRLTLEIIDDTKPSKCSFLDRIKSLFRELLSRYSANSSLQVALSYFSRFIVHSAGRVNGNARAFESFAQSL